MSRAIWNRIKQSKGFYIRSYRRAGRFLITSIGLNFFLISSICIIYINRPEHTFYATSGIVPPVALTALADANDSAQALIAPEAMTHEVKIIPQ